MQEKCLLWEDSQLRLYYIIILLYYNYIDYIIIDYILYYYRYIIIFIINYITLLYFTLLILLSLLTQSPASS